MCKIAIIKFSRLDTYKTIFVGPETQTTINLIKLLIRTFNYQHQDNIAIAFIRDDKLSFYVTPYEFLRSV